MRTKVTRKSFSPAIVSLAARAKEHIRERYSLRPGNNVDLICEKLAGLDSERIVYAECGVFQGNTLFAVASFLENAGSKKLLYGFDSFEGFPQFEVDRRDHPSFFSELLKRGLISKEHYEKAAARTKNFSDTSHLHREYFVDVGNVFDIAADFENVRLVKGIFSETLCSLSEPVGVLFLDCDLYRSYKECLDTLYEQVVRGGAIIFDEYYSLKYPGARLAVYEFFKDKDGQFEVYLTEEGFERWCFVKP